MTALVLRPLRDGDVEATARLWQRAKRDAYPYLKTERRYTAADNLAYFRSVICAQGSVWVAVAAQGVVGFIALTGQHIDQLYVAVERQGSGVGRALLDKAKALSPDGLSLFTFQRNVRARRFYERHGFRAVAYGVSPVPECEPDVRYEWTPPAP